MKNVNKYLNPTQLLHLTIGCVGKKCEFYGCTNCCCDMREDAKYCCAAHRSAMNNRKDKKKHFQVNENRRINKKNTLIFEDLYNRGFRCMDEGGLNIRGINFEAFPVPILISGRQVAAFGSIAVWMDVNKIYHLEKIES